MVIITIVSLSLNAIDGLLRYIFQVLNGNFAETGRMQNQKEKNAERLVSFKLSLQQGNKDKTKSLSPHHISLPYLKFRTSLKIQDKIHHTISRLFLN